VKASLRNDPHFRPLVILAACIFLIAAVDWGQWRFLSPATPFSTLQIFANIGLVALGLGLAMMIREFDLSVVGMFGLAGCVAVMTGAAHPWVGIGCALAVGLRG
jgi:ribose/xylose/arabinose/galactoside ABC-type transport system permease subunit